MRSLPHIQLCLAILRFFIVSFICFESAAQSTNANQTLYAFTQADIDYLKQFSLSALPPPPSKTNAVADSIVAAKLGHKLFFDTRLSANNKIACASCHQPQKHFTDGLSQSTGLSRLRRNAPSIFPALYGPWKYWDGRKDSLWAQAITPLLDEHEQGLSAKEVADVIATHYADDYSEIFDAKHIQQFENDPTDNDFAITILVNISKAIMAYERQLSLAPSPFDQFVDQLSQNADKTSLENTLSLQQIKGLRLFFGKANCVSCHNGPLFTNFEFHNIGAPEFDTNNVDLGRYDAIESLPADQFNCLSKWSDAKKEDCLELTYLKKQGKELVGAFKTPSLRNVSATAPYMHAGQFATLEAVVAHYNKPTPPVFVRDQHPFRPHFDIMPLNLSESEQQELIAFLNSLTSPIPSYDSWWQTP